MAALSTYNPTANVVQSHSSTGSNVQDSPPVWLPSGTTWAKLIESAAASGSKKYDVFGFVNCKQTGSQAPSNGVRTFGQAKVVKIGSDGTTLTDIGGPTDLYMRNFDQGSENISAALSASVDLANGEKVAVYVRSRQQNALNVSNLQCTWDTASNFMYVREIEDVVANFAGLSDTPMTLAGNAGKFLKLNAASDAIEFGDAPDTSGGVAPNISTANPATTLVVTTPSTQGVATNVSPVWSTWSTLMETTAASDATGLTATAFIDAEETGTAPPGGGQRMFVEAKCVKVSSGGVESDIEGSIELYVRHFDTGSANMSGEMTSLVDLAVGEKLRIKVRSRKQNNLADSVGTIQTTYSTTANILYYREAGSGGGGGGASAFTALSDTPGSLGTAGQFLKVNAEATALEFTDAPSGGSSTWVAPTAQQAFDAIKDRLAGSNGISLSKNDGTDTFTFGLNGISGQGGKWLKVNSGASGIEYADAPITSLTDSGATTAIQNTVIGMVAGATTEHGIDVHWNSSHSRLNFNVSDPVLTYTGDVTGSGTIENLGNTSFAMTLAKTSAVEEIVEDIVGAMFVNGTNTTATYNDSAGTMRIDASGGSGGGLTLAQVRSELGSMVTGNTETGIDVTYDSGTSKMNFATDLDFTGLTDTPASLTADKFVKVNSAGTALEMSDPAAGFLSSIDTDQFTIPKTTTAQTIVVAAGEVGPPKFHEIKAFTSPSTITTNISQQTNGLRIDSDGLYSLDMQMAIDVETDGPSEWGISLLRTNGLTGGSEVIHQSAIYTTHIRGQVGETETYVQHLQIPVSKFNQGDYLYVAISFVPSAARTLTFNISPGPVLVSFIDVRRYDQANAVSNQTQIYSSPAGSTLSTTQSSPTSFNLSHNATDFDAIEITGTSGASNTWFTQKIAAASLGTSYAATQHNINLRYPSTAEKNRLQIYSTTASTKIFNIVGHKYSTAIADVPQAGGARILYNNSAGVMLPSSQSSPLEIDLVDDVDNYDVAEIVVEYHLTDNTEFWSTGKLPTAKISDTTGSPGGWNDIITRPSGTSGSLYVRYPAGTDKSKLQLYFNQSIDIRLYYVIGHKYSGSILDTEQQVFDSIKDRIVAGTNIALGKNDVNDTITISSYTDEEIQDVVGSLIPARTSATVTSVRSQLDTRYMLADNTSGVVANGSTFTYNSKRYIVGDFRSGSGAVIGTLKTSNASVISSNTIGLKYRSGSTAGATLGIMAQDTIRIGSSTYTITGVSMTGVTIDQTISVPADANVTINKASSSSYATFDAREAAALPSTVYLTGVPAGTELTVTSPGQAGIEVTYDDAGNMLHFAVDEQSFAGLTDTPNAFTSQGGKFVAVNSGATALEFVDAPSGGGSTTFAGLTDTPAAFGTAGQIVKVNSGADGLVFDDASWVVPSAQNMFDALASRLNAGTGITITPNDAVGSDHYTIASSITQTSNSDIDARIASFARANSPSGMIADARIPSGITRDSEVQNFAKIGNSALVPENKIHADIARSSEIATYAMATSPSGTIPIGLIPTTIARTSQLPTVPTASSFNFKDLTGTPATYDDGKILQSTASGSEWVTKPTPIDLSDATTKQTIKAIVGEMVDSNTESGIAVTYESSDHTLDFSVTNPSISLTGDISTGGSRDLGGNAISVNLSNTVNVQEIVQDIVGDSTFFVSGDNTTVVYDDSANTLKVNADDTDAFIDLSDTPGSFTANQYVKVNAAGTGLVFANLPSDNVLTSEQVEDIVGAMVSGGTESGIAVTYSDNQETGRGKLDFTVASQLPAITNNRYLTTSSSGALQWSTIPTVPTYSGGTGISITGTSPNFTIARDALTDSDIPSGIARDSEIATYARATSPSGTIPDAQIPSSIARDSEVPDNFTDLDDAPSSFTGEANNVVRVNGAENALEFHGMAFTDLGQAPSSGDANEFLRWNSDGTALENTEIEFTDLDNTPSTLSGQGGKHVAVNAAGDALEFVDAPTFTSSWVDPSNQQIYTAIHDRLIQGTNMTLAKSDANDTITFNVADSAIDGRIASYARSNPSGTIAAAQIPQLDNTKLPATIDIGRIPNLTNAKLPTIDIGKIPTTIAREADVPDNFTDLDDTPSSLSGHGNKLVSVNAGGNQLEFITAPSGSFVGLSDTPSALVEADRGKFVVVNSTNNGVEYLKLVAGTNLTFDSGTSGQITMNASRRQRWRTHPGRHTHQRKQHDIRRHQVRHHRCISDRQYHRLHCGEPVVHSADRHAELA